MRSLVLAVAGVLMLSGCSDEEVPATDVSSLRVTGEREYAQVYYAKLAPDGQRLLYNHEDGTCVRRLDGGEPLCLGEAMEGIANAGSAAWSPDGSRIAITEELNLGEEPDVWVLDVESGDMRNLTDDGVGAFGMAEPIPDDAVVDMWPAWTADGEHVRFLRRAEGDAVDVVSVPAGGGDVTRLRSVDLDIEELRSVAWQQDSLAWLTGPEEGERVVRVAELGDGEPTDLLRGEFDVLSYSADGEYLMADRSWDEEPVPGAARVVPTGGGDPVPVASGDVLYPAWSPEGHAIAYVELPGTIRVVGTPAGESLKLRKVAEPGPLSERLGWVPGALLLTVGEKVTALTLEG